MKQTDYGVQNQTQIFHANCTFFVFFTHLYGAKGLLNSNIETRHYNPACETSSMGSKKFLCTFGPTSCIQYQT